jgi:tripartite-type tricarboxylate transporter receptor subunit TctC
MIVPFSPGGLTDVLGRVLAAGMQTLLVQSVVVENVGGASGSIGTGRVARAAPDGYTVVLGIWNTHVANGVTYTLDLRRREGFRADRAMRRGSAGACGEEDLTGT